MPLATTFTLETERLRLRIPSKADIPHIFAASRVKGFNDGMGWEPPETIEEMNAPLERSLESWKNGNGFSFTIGEKSTGDFLGRISIRKTKEKAIWNIGFFTHPTHQGKGIMSEAVAAILSFGFTKLKASRIEADYALWNKASEKVLQKNGLQFVEFIEKGLFKKGKWVAENKVAIDKMDWQKHQS